MRISALSSLFLLGAFAGSAHADRVDRSHASTELSTGELPLTGPARPARLAPSLTASEISLEVAPHAPEIGRCYLERLGDTRRGGRLELTVVIARDGSIVSLKAEAAGLPAKAARKVEACIREIVETVQFPARRGDTIAVVPYVFQKTDAPNAGPLESCWNPRGC